MRTIIYLILILLSVASLGVKSAVDVNNSIVEIVKENSSFQVIQTNKSTVSIGLYLNSNRPVVLERELAKFAFDNGIDLKQKSSVFFQRYIFVLQESQIPILLQKVEKELSNSNLSTSNVKIMILGDIAEQRVLGELYRILKNLTLVNDVNQESDELHVKELGSYRKSESEYFSKLIANLLFCNSDNIKTVDFLIDNEHIFCVVEKSSVTLNQGEIANKVLSFKNFLNKLMRSQKGYLEWLGHLPLEENITFTDSFKSYLSNISLELISIYYQELNKIRTDAIENNPNILNPSNQIEAGQYFDFLRIESSDLGLALVFEKSFNVCQFYDCSLLGMTSEVDIFNSYPPIMKFDYDESNAIQSNKFIANTILRPLLLSDYPINKLTILKLGWDEEYSNSLFIEEDLFKEIGPPNELFEIGQNSNNCFEKLNLNNNQWVVEKLLTFGAFNNIYLKGNFKVLENNCIENNSELNANTILVEYQESLTDEQFEILKRSFQNRLLLMQETPIYLLLQRVYSYPIYEYQSNVLEKLQFEEIKAFSSLKTSKQ